MPGEARTVRTKTDQARIARIVTGGAACALLFLLGTVAAGAFAQGQAQPKAAASAQPSAKSLAIERLALHQFEDGPLLAPEYMFVPGETAYFSCRVTGYRIVRKEEEQNVKLAWQMSVVDPSGVEVEKDQAGRIEDRLLPQDKNWMPKFISSFVVPPFAPSGTYRVVVKIADEAGGVDTAGELSFQVHGRAVERSDTLVARNFQFLRAETDRTAMTAAIYHPGETLWARFDITGYKFGEGNRLSVDYGLAVLRATGEQVFAQPVAASEAKDSFYPQRYVPGALSLTLDPAVPKGAYILLITVRDKLGDQAWETRQPFEID
jgi:hypothetical protein